MIPARLACCLALCLLSCAWATAALLAQSARLDHRGLVAAIRTGETLPENAGLDRAIATDERALRVAPCDIALRRDLLVLLAQQSDRAMLSPDISAADTALTRTQDTLAALLACAPMDGNAWLDFAKVSIFRQGFTAEAAGAYRMSATVAPGESWLAEKRLLFALKFRPLLDGKDREVARHDIAVLKRAHPNRMSAIMKAAKAETPDDLSALFAPAASE